MSEAFSPYYDGNDYIEEDEKTSIDKKWDIKLPDGTWVSWRGNVFNYDHLNNLDTSSAPVPLSDSNGTCAEMYQNLPDPPVRSFCTFYDPKSRTTYGRTGIRPQKDKILILSSWLSTYQWCHRPIL
jgi:hypothetical protein